MGELLGIFGLVVDIMVCVFVECIVCDSEEYFYWVIDFSFNILWVVDV